MYFSCLQKSLGEAGEIEPETEGVLISYGVDYSEFSQEVNNSLTFVTSLPIGCHYNIFDFLIKMLPFTKPSKQNVLHIIPMYCRCAWHINISCKQSSSGYIGITLFIYLFVYISLKSNSSLMDNLVLSLCL